MDNFWDWKLLNGIYFCYHKEKGLILGSVREWTDGTFRVIHDNEVVGDYISQEHAKNWLEGIVKNWDKA